MALLMYGFYFLTVFFIKNMQKKNFFYAHHSNFCSFLYCLLFVCFISGERPSFDNDSLNDTLCQITAIAWAVIKTLQSYSIMLLALYRYLAVYHPASFKKLNKSNKTLMIPILIIWVLSIGIFLATKFGFDTSYGYSYCFDGYSQTGFAHELNYFIVFSVFSILIPLGVVMLAYYETYEKIKANDAELEHDYDNNSATMGKSSILAAQNAEINGHNSPHNGTQPVPNGLKTNHSSRPSLTEAGHHVHLNMQKFLYVMTHLHHLHDHHHDNHHHDPHNHHHHHHYNHHHKFLKQLKALDICYSFYFISSIFSNSRYVFYHLLANANISCLLFYQLTFSSYHPYHL